MNLNQPTADFLSLTIADEKHGLQNTLILIDMLLQRDVDYYEIVLVLVQVKTGGYLKNEITFLLSRVPEVIFIKDLEVSTIHSMIPRWTPTKYHTGPIQNVLKDIQRKCIGCQIGLYVYNSNLNPRNRRTTNDPYVLMITSSECGFLDLNRRRAYKYTY